MLYKVGDLGTVHEKCYALLAGIMLPVLLVTFVATRTGCAAASGAARSHCRACHSLLTRRLARGRRGSRPLEESVIGRRILLVEGVTQPITSIGIACACLLDWRAPPLDKPALAFCSRPLPGAPLSPSLTASRGTCAGTRAPPASGQPRTP